MRTLSGLLLVWLGLISTARAAEVLHYYLAPGSTITPVRGGGQTEPLAGRLDWVLMPPPVSDTILVFNAVGLSFHSDSFALELDITRVNDVATAVHTNEVYTVFEEVADLTGLDTRAGYLSSLRPGTYYGPPTRPVVLRYPEVWISPIGGGFWQAQLNLIAVMQGVMINAAPSFTLGSDLLVPENGGAQFVPGWASDIRAGPASEAGQKVTFTVTTDADSLFAVPPTMAPDGRLMFTPARNHTGVARVTVRLKDDGGTAYDGEDTSPPQTFTITVLSPCQAVQALILEVHGMELDPAIARPLEAALTAAGASFQRGNWLLGMTQLESFERRVQLLVAPSEPGLAEQWIAAAEEIADRLVPPTFPPGGRSPQRSAGLPHGITSAGNN
jgi:hypothetical protein